MSQAPRLYGPFAQILTMDGLPRAGPLRDEGLSAIADGGIVVEDGRIASVGFFEDIVREARARKIVISEIPGPCVATPGLVDCHTHMCFSGSRAGDCAARLSGKSYLEIAGKGGGILDTVRKTRAASRDDLTAGLAHRWKQHLREGVTTCEVKSGYGLGAEHEIRMLLAIREAAVLHGADLVPTCLAAHVRPPEFADNPSYLETMASDLLPEIVGQKLASRVDAYCDEGAFSPDELRPYLLAARALGLDIVVHADQFRPGGGRLAAELGALSADHLESSGDDDLDALKRAGVIAVALPGASLGLGMRFAPARRILDRGMVLAIASDFNPGSAPMGDLLLQASLLGAAERLTMAETWAGITCRAAAALTLGDRGRIAPGQKADIAAFLADDYREILYRQGRLKPKHVWKAGALV